MNDNPVRLVATRLIAGGPLAMYYWGEITLARDGFIWTSQWIRLNADSPTEAQQELDQLAQDLVSVTEPVKEG